MKKLLLISLLIFSCGNPGNPPNTTNENQVTEDQVQQLKDMRLITKYWAQTGDNGMLSTDADDPQGDAMLWAGLSCIAGDDSQCQAAVRSVRYDGMVCRSPNLCDRETNASSRDMFLGALLTITKTKNEIMANKILAYLESNNHQLCDNDDDNRCDLSLPQHGAAWATMRKVYTYIGLPVTWEMIFYDMGDEYVLRLESQFAGIKPSGIQADYEAHLVGVELLIRQRTGYWSEDLQRTANTLRTRQPDNPFYEYLTNGKTKKAAELTLAKCPRNKPEYSHSWAWQRNETKEAWKESMGWDCIFMANLLIGQ